MAEYKEPVHFFKTSPMIKDLEAGYKDDMIKADTVKSDDYGELGAVYYLPDEKWARRIIGTFANAVSSRSEARGSAVLLKKRGGWLVSVRAPKARPVGADLLCSLFETGGGRAAAAGINFLPDSDLASFLEKFKKKFDESCYGF